MIRRLDLTALTVAALAALAGLAGADTPRVKQIPGKVAAAAAEAFTAALAADAAGDLRSAREYYLRAFAIAPHPSVMFNLADVQRRLGELAAAHRSYETYLAMSPGAPDRADVEALIARITRAPGTIQVSTQPNANNTVDLANAYILVDGDIKRRPGDKPALATAPNGAPAVLIEASPGSHLLDVVTVLAYARVRCVVKPGARSDCSVYAPPRIDGGLVLAGDDRVGVVLDSTEKRGKINERVVAPTGKQRFMVRDRQYECAPLSVDVPTDDSHVAYAYLDTLEYDRLERCRTLTIRQHTLAF